MRSATLTATTVVLSIMASSAARAETTFAVEPLLQFDGKKSPDPSVEGWFSRSFDKSPFGISGFWWVMKDWAEIHAGPTWTPTEGLTLGADIGIEQNGAAGLRLRYAVSAWYIRDKFAVSGSMEFANDLFIGDTSVIWYDILATYQAHERLTVGLRCRRAVGTGPFVQLNLPEVHGKLWAVWAPLDMEHASEPNVRSALLGVTLEL